MSFPSLANSLASYLLTRRAATAIQNEPRQPGFSFQIDKLSERLTAADKLLGQTPLNYSDPDFCNEVLCIQVDLEESIQSAKIKDGVLTVFLQNASAVWEETLHVQAWLDGTLFPNATEEDVARKLIATQMVKIGWEIYEDRGRFFIVTLGDLNYQTDLKECSCEQSLCIHRMLAEEYTINRDVLEVISVSDVNPSFFPVHGH